MYLPRVVAGSEWYDLEYPVTQEDSFKNMRSVQWK